MGEHKFKVGDKVVAKRTYEGTNKGEAYTIAGYARATKIGEWVYLSELRNDITDDGSFLEKNFEPVAVADSNGNQPAPLTIREGRYYRTRDGRKVGPMRPWDSSSDYQWESDGYLWKDDGENYEKDSVHTIVVEWTDELATSDSDTIDDWYYGKASKTTGFTVPLDAPEFGGGARFKVGDRVHYKDAYCEGVGVIHSDNDAANGYGWFVTVEEKDCDHASFNDNTTRIFTEDKLRLVAEATSGKLESTAPTLDDLYAAKCMVETGVCTINEVRKHLGLGPVSRGHELARAA